MILLRFLAAVIVLAAIIIGGVVLLSRFADGPIGMIAGGPLRSGSLHAGPEPDWGSIRETDTVEFQLLDPPRSRTTWILEHQGRIYIPSGYMTSGWGKLWKQWPPEAERDGRALLRVSEILYPRRLARVREGPAIEPLVAELNRKYDAGASVAAVQAGDLWLFELQPRTTDPAL